MPAITELLNRWIDLVEQHAPEVRSTLRPGATAEQIAAVESAIGFELPDDVRTWFQLHDGQEYAPKVNILFGLELLPLDQLLHEWREWQDLADYNEEFGPDSTSSPEGAIAAAYTTPGWIPLAQSPASGNYLGIDLNPEPQGTRGQVINFGRDEDDKCVVATSWTEFVRLVIDELEAGRVVFDDTKNSGMEGHTYYGDLDKGFLHFNDLIKHLHSLDRYDGTRLHFHPDPGWVNPN